MNPEFLNHVKNPKGEGDLVDKSFLLANGKTYLTTAACMSVHSEGMTFANAHPNIIEKSPMFADNIVVMSCQVTDLSILNDLRIAEDLSDRFPGKNYFIGGCLARRFDIELPYPWQRIDSLRVDYQELKDLTLVNYEKPFWIPEFEDSLDPMQNGNLFRQSYPIRIGVGCTRNCKYCTIKWTRGANYEMNNIDILEAQFKKYDNVVLIADSPSPMQVKMWCEIASRNKKPISFRNVEPQVTQACGIELAKLAQEGLLPFYHSPVQSSNFYVLTEMNRDPFNAANASAVMANLKIWGTKIATNIIIDYKDSKGNVMEDDHSEIYDLFDYVSWNPYWDGNWDRKEAEARFQKYLVDKDFTIVGCPDDKIF